MEIVLRLPMAMEVFALLEGIGYKGNAQRAMEEMEGVVLSCGVARGVNEADRKEGFIRLGQVINKDGGGFAHGCNSIFLYRRICRKHAF